MSESPTSRGAKSPSGPRNEPPEAGRPAVDHEARPGRTVSFVSEVDLTQVGRIWAETPEPRRPSSLAIVVKAVAMALREFPEANRRAFRAGVWPFRAARLYAFDRRDVAVAIEREVPGVGSVEILDILRDADRSSLDAITAHLNKLSTSEVTEDRRWREAIDRDAAKSDRAASRTTPSSPDRWVRECGGAALVGSTSDNRVDASFGASDHPIAVTFGLAKLRPVVIGKAVEPVLTFFLTLNCDRGVLSRGQAARFFDRIVGILERAEAELAPFLPAAAPVTREEFPTVETQQIPGRSDRRR